MEDKKTKHAWTLKSNSLFPKMHIFKIIWSFFLDIFFSPHKNHEGYEWHVTLKNAILDSNFSSHFVTVKFTLLFLWNQLNYRLPEVLLSVETKFIVTGDDFKETTLVSSSQDGN